MRIKIARIRTSRNMLSRTSIGCHGYAMWGGMDLQRKSSSSTRMRGRCWTCWAFPVVAAVLLATPLVGVGSTWQGVAASSSSSSVGATSQACVYEGHLRTEKNWYGYLANITVMTTGRLTFEFVYPADKCCQNVLFYSEDQMAVINARMNCWQKEYPLRPEDDQILRLTPRFSWSGCHKTYPNNVGTYVCKGGRSFTVDHHRHQYGQQHERRGQHHQQHGWRQTDRGGDGGGGHGYGTWSGGMDGRQAHGQNRPTTWYIALSNCGSLFGLELRYRMEVYGHVGECRTGMPAHFDYYRPGGASSHGAAPSPRPVVAAADDQSDAVDDDDDAADEDVVAESTTSCVVEGDINTTDTWHVIGNASRTTTALSDAAWFKFDFTFPQSMMLLNMGIYGEAEQTRLLEDDDSCWHKHSVIPSQRVHDRLLELSTRTGCQLKNTTKFGVSCVCRGQQRFTPGPAGPAAGSERQIVVAVFNCRLYQLVASYRVEMHGFVCNAAPGVNWSRPLGRLDSPTSIVRAAVSAVLAQPLLSLGVLTALASSTGRMTPS